MSKKRLSLNGLHVFTARFQADVWEWLEKSAEAHGTTVNAELDRVVREVSGRKPTGRKPRPTREKK